MLEHRPWEQPELVGVNRLVPRSPLYAFPNIDDARALEREESPWFRSLNGNWRFRILGRPESVPKNFAAVKLDDSKWDTVAVPGCWTMQGYDRPHYTNVQMPFFTEPPFVPEDNPTGLYRKTFKVPKSWSKRRIVLHVGAAESVLCVWINGTAVGMSKDSRLPAEFDITKHVQTGNNVLAAAVIRWSDATWLEDQDHWFHAGVHREVYLYATEQVHIADVQLSCELGEDLTTGECSVATTIGGVDALLEGWSTEVRVETPDGKALHDAPLREEVPVFPWGGELATFTGAHYYKGPITYHKANLAKVKPWSSEAPNRYRVFVSLIDPDGAVREVVSQWTGFRRVRIEKRELLINGKPVYVRGVNRHDHDPETGKTVSRAEMRREVELMKQFGFNALRTSHYPNDPYLLDLCDELGLYVIDEANIESHARWRSLARDARYQSAFIDRCQRMVQRDKNHVCIIGWSLGNEAGYGPCHDAAAAWIRRYDSTRFVQYEGPLLGRWENGDEQVSRVTDVICPMYPEIQTIVDWAKRNGDGRPLIMCEYAHAMGNANGSLHDYWAAIEKHKGLQGGFIWDWRDQGLLNTDENGKEYYAFGGQFGDEPNDANFCINGLMGPDLYPHAGVREHKQLAAPVEVHAENMKQWRVAIRNKQDFTDTAWLAASWELLVNGEVVRKGKLKLPVIAPGAREVVDVPVGDFPLPKGEEAHLTLRFHTRRKEPWAPKGFEVCWQQLTLAREGVRAPVLSNTVETGVDKTNRELSLTVISSGSIAASFDTELGYLSQIFVEEKPLLLYPVRLCLWRAATDNDGIRTLPGRGNVLDWWKSWKLDDLEPGPATVTVEERKGRVQVCSQRKWQASGKLTIRDRQEVTMQGGVIRLDQVVQIPEGLDDLPRVGWEFGLGHEFTKLEWFGLGPHESYADRKTSTAVGRYRSSVAEQYVPYVLPQEHGSHADTRWFTLQNRRGVGIRISAKQLFSFSASHYTADDLMAARHTADLMPRDEVIVHVDAAMRGIGTGACGPDTLPQYRVRGGEYKFTWYLSPRGTAVSN